MTAAGTGALLQVVLVLSGRPETMQRGMNTLRSFEVLGLAHSFLLTSEKVRCGALSKRPAAALPDWCTRGSTHTCSMARPALFLLAECL